MKKPLLLLSVMSFLLFLSSLAVKSFKLKHLLVQEALLLCLLLFSLQPLPLPSFSGLPTTTVLLGTPREFPSRSSSLFFLQVLLHLLQIAFHNDVVHFGGSQLNRT